MSGFAAFRALVWRQTFDSLSNKTCKLFYQSALNQKIMPKTNTNTNTVAKTKTIFWQPFKQNIQIVLSVCPQLKDDAKDKHRDNGKDKDKHFTAVETKHANYFTCVPSTHLWQICWTRLPLFSSAIHFYW